VIVRLDFSDEESKARRLRVRASKGERTDVVGQLGPDLPFRGNSVDEIVLGRALAFVDDFVATLEEVWRISKAGALVHARLPHASSSWSTSRDPRLRRSYTVETFRFFDPNDGDERTHAAFEIDRANLHVKSARAPSDNGRGLVRAFERIANKSRGMQYRSERWLAPLFGGFEEFSIVLSAVKAPPIP
jgi:ubiquinone/menaquinone biosynthesis C-methylase UbiE